MNRFEMATESLTRNLGFASSYLNDLSEQEMFVRPVPGANHAAWQFGHLAVAETNMLKAVKPAAAAALPTGFAEKFSKETAKIDDAKSFPGKAEIVDAFTKARNATIAWSKTLTEADLDVQTPENIRGFAPTVGHLLELFPDHTMMHIGQLQVLRRKLGKPVLF